MLMLGTAVTATPLGSLKPSRREPTVVGERERVLPSRVRPGIG